MTQPTTEKTLELDELHDIYQEAYAQFECQYPYKGVCQHYLGYSRARGRYAVQAIATHLEAKHAERVKGLVDALKEIRRNTVAPGVVIWRADKALSDFESNLDSQHGGKITENVVATANLESTCSPADPEGKSAHRISGKETSEIAGSNPAESTISEGGE